MTFSYDVSVEFSHIYGDQHISQSHRLGAECFSTEVSKLRNEGKSISSLVLVDDVHVSKFTISLEDFKQELAKHGGVVDAFVLESQLLSTFKTLLRNLPKDQLYYQPFRAATKRVLFLKTPEGPVALGDIANRKFKPTCALLVATWNLARLGVVPVEGIPVAQYSLSILEDKFREIEMKALRIIKASNFSSEAERIGHSFY